MSYSENNTLFTVDGTIQALRISPGIVNLIEDIQKGSYFTGVIAGISGEAGVLANSASLSMYDGEDVEHIALLINGQLAIGTFEWLRDLRVGDDVRLVVSGIDGGPLFVHAILRTDDHLLWTPFSIDHTRSGWILHGLKLGAFVVIFTWLMFGCSYLITPDSRITLQEFLLQFIIPIVMIAIVMFLSLKSMMPLGAQAEDIFRALGVPGFKRFKIKPYSIFKLHFMDGSDPDARRKKYVFQFRDALAAHKKRLGL
jgi:hypothetical protein